MTVSTSHPIPSSPAVQNQMIPVPVFPTWNLCIPKIPRNRQRQNVTHLL